MGILIQLGHILHILQVINAAARLVMAHLDFFATILIMSSLLQSIAINCRLDVPKKFKIWLRRFKDKSKNAFLDYAVCKLLAKQCQLNPRRQHSSSSASLILKPVLFMYYNIDNYALPKVQQIIGFITWTLSVEDIMSNALRGAS